MKYLIICKITDNGIVTQSETIFTQFEKARKYIEVLYKDAKFRQSKNKYYYLSVYTQFLKDEKELQDHIRHKVLVNDKQHNQSYYIEV